MTSTRLSCLGTVVVLAVVLVAGYVYEGRRRDSRGRDLLVATLRADFMTTWAAYKQARRTGDADTILRFFPPGHVVRAVRHGKVYLIHRKAAEREARIRYRVFHDVEGPYLVVAPSGCCIWAVTLTRAIPEGETPPAEEEGESIQSMVSEYDAESGSWQSIAVANGVDNPRVPATGQVIDLLE
jgi:hypothetical protein